MYSKAKHAKLKRDWVLILTLTGFIMKLLTW